MSMRIGEAAVYPALRAARTYTLVLHPLPSGATVIAWSRTTPAGVMRLRWLLGFPEPLPGSAPIVLPDGVTLYTVEQRQPRAAAQAAHLAHHRPTRTARPTLRTKRSWFWFKDPVRLACIDCWRDAQAKGLTDPQFREMLPAWLARVGVRLDSALPSTRTIKRWAG